MMYPYTPRILSAREIEAMTQQCIKARYPDD